MQVYQQHERPRVIALDIITFPKKKGANRPLFVVTRARSDARARDRCFMLSRLPVAHSAIYNLISSKADCRQALPSSPASQSHRLAAE